MRAGGVTRRVLTGAAGAALLGAAVLGARVAVGAPRHAVASSAANAVAQGAVPAAGSDLVAHATAPTPTVVGPVPEAWAPAPRPVPGASPPPVDSAAAALVLDEGSAAVLYDQHGDTPLPPASLTKIATAAVAIEHGNLDRLVTTDVDSRVMRGSTVMGLLPGDQFTVRDLLYGMMLPSGNDAALAIGRAVSGSDAAFVAEMNALAARLGLHETHFVNAHGLNASGHLTSAHDLALLARYAMGLPEFRTIVTTTAWTAQGSRSIALTNVINDVLYTVPGADGVKSGYTRQAGRTLVASATRGGHRVYVVILNDQQRDPDVTALIDWAFASFEWSAASAARPQGQG